LTKGERLEHEQFYRTMAEHYAREYWGIELTCPIEFVNRDWKSTYGYFQIKKKTGECKIVMSHKVNAKRSVEDVLATLKHELVHWYLWSIGKPYNDDDEEFIRECLRIGARISGSKKAQEAYRKYCENRRGDND
jgi:predicted SprT family Zn-dependent metalloprotease